MQTRHLSTLDLSHGRIILLQKQWTINISQNIKQTCKLTYLQLHSQPFRHSLVFKKIRGRFSTVSYFKSPTYSQHILQNGWIKTALLSVWLITIPDVKLDVRRILAVRYFPNRRSVQRGMLSQNPIWIDRYAWLVTWRFTSLTGDSFLRYSIFPDTPQWPLHIITWQGSS